ncbi:hypothetical protein HMPREF9246_0431 [Anaerococcus hydrogenalis ACS-025-V-Sch4]|uniref:Uncharacterized protein n=1 Tax=Anaerococcus hydrogenalis ACS-025-V-Sch4 TaxID=879306 RepID=F0H0M5_9FIRM|nr:hypothetical protein HMPREF9246_0431 [Anaerococcus hydrogenalis ACS-025-V-Sch4]
MFGWFLLLRIFLFSIQRICFFVSFVIQRMYIIFSLFNL